MQEVLSKTAAATSAVPAPSLEGGLFASPRKKKFVLSLLLVAVTLWVYAPLRNYPFIDYDDNLYVTQNIPVESGLNWKSVRWAFTTVEAANYHPVTWLSHELDVQLFGLNPAGHHLASILLHSLNTVLLFLLLARATGSIWRSLVVATLFAVHPLNVQSVAWISERKNLLCTMFGLGAFWAYARYAARPNWKRYATLLAPFILGLLSKPMLVTLPFALLLLDYWPLNRFPAVFYENNGAQECKDRIGLPRTTIRQLVAEKIPLLALAGASCWITYRAQRLFGGMEAQLKFPLPYRLGNAVYSYADYLYKTCWPRRLAIFYPHPGASLAAWEIALAGLLLVFVSVVSARAYRRSYFIVGWLWYLGTLVPVIGLMQAGAQARADRYVYFPLWGVFILVVWSLADLARGHNSRRALASVGVLAVAALSWQARIQLAYWQNSATLFARALEITPDNNYISHANLGSALKDMGKYEEAVPHFQYVLEHFPEAAAVRNDFGTDLLLEGKPREAAQQYAQAFSSAVGSAPLQGAIAGNLAMAQERTGDVQRALASYQEALRLDPLLYNAHVGLGLLFYREGRMADAVSHLEASIRILPTPLAYYGLGQALEKQNRLPEAAEAYRSALQLAPGMPEASRARDEVRGKLASAKPRN